jgi:hypothetical protein
MAGTGAVTHELHRYSERHDTFFVASSTFDGPSSRGRRLPTIAIVEKPSAAME